MKNKYEIRGDVTAIFLNSPKYGNMETLISTNKLQKVNEYTGSWCPDFNEYTKSFYAIGFITYENGKRKKIRLHRLVMDAPS